ncbi:hypothetical protein ACFV1C_11740 [Streptomyces sp. NPDC059605]|uniref:hypothetical protein n=1 Tax=unclassified Streptomyces TaxID=2593676 RepID=UPI00367C1702
MSENLKKLTNSILIKHQIDYVSHPFRREGIFLTERQKNLSGLGSGVLSGGIKT